MQITKFTGEELKKFINSSSFRLLKNIPISKHRAISHINNTRKDKNDIILYVAWEQDEIIAYRTIYADYLFFGNEKLKVGWLSGNWVIPSKRRQGLASKLFKISLEDWNNHLLFTNFAPESKAVYDKSGDFKLLKTKKGVRGYLRFNFHYLLPPKHTFFKNIKGVLKWIDYLLNLFADLRILIIDCLVNMKEIKLEYIQQVDNESAEFIYKWKSKEITNRSPGEMDFVLQYPWVIPNVLKDDINSKYFFSSTANPFININLKIYNKQDMMIGYVMILIKGKELKIPYLYYEQGSENLILKVLLKHMSKLKLNMMTVYHEKFAHYIKKHFTFFLMKKNMKQDYFATHQIVKKFNEFPNKEDVLFQDGDGDPAFV
jgi:hypothetical protein